MIAHGRFEGNLRLQVPGKVFGESGQSVCLNYLKERRVVRRSWVSEDVSPEYSVVILS